MSGPRLDLAERLPSLADLGRVHLIAVGGIGVSAVARLLHGRGLQVSGSDAKDSAMLSALRAEGIAVTVGHDAGVLEGVDTVVVSSAVRADNPELAAARARGLRVLHRSQALSVAVEGRDRVTVAGANGKTTTTAMLVAALDGAGADPTYAVGGELVATGSNAAWGRGPAVLEADESDGTFVVYRPSVAVVTSVQPDHLDYYGTAENVEAAYVAYVASLRAGGLLVACADDDGAARLAEAARGQGTRVTTYGTRPDADVVLSSLTRDGLGTRSLLRAWGADHELAVPAPGLHNALDAAAAFAAATAGFGAEASAALSGLAAFQGVRRRFEVRGDARGVSVVDDYAHNPAKVAAVVSSARELTSGRLHVAFQPHLYSRTRDFADAFAHALAPADDVVLLPVYGAREDPMPGVSSELIAAPLRRESGGEVTLAEGFADAARLLATRAGRGDLVLTVGAGDVTTLAPLVLAALRGEG